MKFAQSLLILAVVVDVHAQYFDFFSAFKPQTLRPIFEPTKPPRRTHATERYQDIRRTTEHTTKLIRKTTKTNKQTNKKSKIDNIIDDGRNTINYDPRSKETPIILPGVNPAVVNGPPITNKPPRPYVPRPIAGLDQDDSSVTPELIIGPNEDYMTSVEKQRYIDMAEKKCEDYMGLTTVRVEAIPLVPSPRPVVVNVSTCTWSVPLVVGGSVVTIQQFPHMALLGWTRVQDWFQSSGYSWKCGGSLVSERHVLTAAHCAYQERDDSVIIGPPRVVQLGSSRLDDPGAIVQRVSSVTRHPKYHPPQSYHDIAVVTMTSAVTFSSAIRPACLGAPPAPGEHFIATGWGKTEFGGEQSNQLRGVSLSVWSREDCGTALGNTRKLPRGPDSSQTCAGEKGGGKDTCQGDSGGPAQVLSQCSWRVLAVTSAGRSCGAPETPALYANVPLAFVAKVAYGEEDLDEHSRPSSDSSNRREDYNRPNSNSNHRQDDYNRPNSNSNNRQNDYNRPNSNSNNRQDDYNIPNGNSNNRQDDYNGPNSNSNNRQNGNSRPNSNSNNRQDDYNRPNSNSNNRQNDYNRPNSDSNNRQNEYNRPNSNNRQDDYNRPNSNSNNRQDDYNRPNSNSNNRQDDYNQQNGNSNSRRGDYDRDNKYNKHNSDSNNRQNDYNRPNSNSQQNNSGRPTSHSNNRPNEYNRESDNSNENSNSNRQQNDHNDYYNRNSNYQQYQRNERTTTAPKWNENRRNTDYDDPTYYSTLELPYGGFR